MNGFSNQIFDAVGCTYIFGGLELEFKRQFWFQIRVREDFCVYL